MREGLNTYLTTRAMRSFLIASVLTMAINQLNTTVDGIIVSHLIGPDGVDDVRTRGVFHGLTLRHGSSTVGDIGKHLHEDGIVKHRGIEQLAFHGVGQVLIPAHAPLVVLVEAFKGFVVGWEHGLGTRLSQRLGLA